MPSKLHTTGKHVRAPVHNVSMLGCWDVWNGWDVGKCGMGEMLGCVEWVGCSDVWNGWAARTCGISGMLICVGWVGCSDVWNR